jgi:hypothetical protein
MKVILPDECMFNAGEPAACEWYFTGLGLLADLFISCLSEAMPERSTRPIMATPWWWDFSRSTPSAGNGSPSSRQPAAGAVVPTAMAKAR